MREEGKGKKEKERRIKETKLKNTKERQGTPLSKAAHGLVSFISFSHYLFNVLLHLFYCSVVSEAITVSMSPGTRSWVNVYLATAMVTLETAILIPESVW